MGQIQALPAKLLLPPKKLLWTPSLVLVQHLEWDQNVPQGPPAWWVVVQCGQERESHRMGWDKMRWD